MVMMKVAASDHMGMRWVNGDRLQDPVADPEGKIRPWLLIQFGYRLWAPLNEEINMRCWETYYIDPPAESLDPPYEADPLAECLNPPPRPKTWMLQMITHRAWEKGHMWNML